jgi:GT2 family glycosyltransferase
LQVSIIIVNYNVRHFLEQCLHAVRDAIQGLAAEVLVIDNASTDGSLNYLHPLFPEVHFIAFAENLGFAKANNHAAGLAKGQHLLFLNPDTLIAADALQQMLGLMQARCAWCTHARWQRPFFAGKQTRLSSIIACIL